MGRILVDADVGAMPGGAGEGRMIGPKKRFARAIDPAKNAARKFGAENGALTAAAISFYVMLSLLPLLLLGVAVLGYVVGSSKSAFDTVVGFFNTFMPTSTFVVDTLADLVRIRGVIGWVGILSLLWTSSQIFVTLESALDGIWEVGKKPGFIHMRLKAMALVLLVGVFLVLSVGSTALTGVLRTAGNSTSGEVHGVVSGLLDVVAIIISIASSIAMFTVVYKLTPDTKVNWRSALVGGAFAGIVWGIAKELYRLYLLHVADFSKIYGSLGSVIILILWIYYSSMILVFGAELAYVHEHGSEEKHEEGARMEGSKS